MRCRDSQDFYTACTSNHLQPYCVHQPKPLPAHCDQRADHRRVAGKLPTSATMLHLRVPRVAQDVVVTCPTEYKHFQIVGHTGTTKSRPAHWQLPRADPPSPPTAVTVGEHDRLLADSGPPQARHTILATHLPAAGPAVWDNRLADARATGATMGASARQWRGAETPRTLAVGRRKKRQQKPHRQSFRGGGGRKKGKTGIKGEKKAFARAVCIICI